MNELSYGEMAMFAFVFFLLGMAVSSAIDDKWKRAAMLMIPVFANLVLFIIRRVILKG